ncbi:VOC family protein [Corynebacterium sp. NPDC060344]|uniref:VOC family protein n=1 Tax=Corynebacterium sp. NPDC060344 TaxID=3347101 RepID=UPI003665C461
MSIDNGTPIWVDLGTTDLDAAMNFYREIFGWNFTTTGEEFGNYQMVDVGVPVGGAALNLNEQGELDPSMPAWFTIYLKVEDMDAALAGVTQHGGTVFVPPMQIGDMGYMAIVSAPSGAAFGLWQPESFEGFDTSGRPGTAVWFDSMSTSFDADAAFYREVFGWENATEEQAGAPYVTNAPGDGARAGLMNAAGILPEGVPSHWQVSFAVEDADATVAKVLELGGTTMMEAQDSPHGRYAVVADPQGAPFGIVELGQG